jgi:outer membrane protein OmpA-like peptidoglycan-associated protein
VLALGAAPANAATAEPDDELQQLLERNEAEAQADAQRLERLVVDDAAIENATSSLVPENSTIPLVAEDSIVPLQTETEEQGLKTVTLTSDLLFEFASAELTDAARGAVGDLANQIPQGASVTVDGHTDAIGEPAANQTLSEQRAAAVAAALTAVRPDLAITTRGFGETQPIASNTFADGTDDSYGRMLNRRVQVLYAS